jgi:mono/diheme cytochrome c family protein
MNPDLSHATPAPEPPPEPQAARRPAPAWLFVLLFLLLYWGMIYFDQRSGWASPQIYSPYHSIEEVSLYQPRVEGPDPRYGLEKFKMYCETCHSSDGLGKPGQAPPLAGSEWALGSPLRMIRIPQNGLAGPIPLKGGVYQPSIPMPPMGAPLSDEDLAAVLTYIRMSWGNKASEVTPEQVKAVRKEIGNRAEAWTADELLKIQ